MAYKPEVYIKAKSLLDARRQKAEQAQLLRKAEVLSVCPEIKKLESEMATIGANAVRFVAQRENQDEKIRDLAKSSLELQEQRKKILVSNGFPADYLDVKYSCPICRDSGSRDGFYCSCFLDLILQCAREAVAPISLLEKSSFSSFDVGKYSDKIDEKFGVSPRKHMSEVLSFCVNYAQEFSLNSDGLFMFGKTGLGKTHLSLAIADAVTKKGFNVCYVSAQNAMNKLEKQHFRRTEDQSDYSEELCGADLLIIDDLGTEFSTSFTVAQIYNIVNTRIVEGRPTVISTNLLLEEIEEKYTQRLSSRLIGSFVPLRFIGSDIRQGR